MIRVFHEMQFTQISKNNGHNLKANPLPAEPDEAERSLSLRLLNPSSRLIIQRVGD